ncbi:MAG: cytidine deaminase [Bulleidia sp.]
MNREQLIAEAFAAMKNSYAPYSNFHVGAALLTDEGTYIHGANIENASFGATNCAERSAMFSAYSQGYRKENLKALAIVWTGENPASPCGICRQVMSELLERNTPVFMVNNDGTGIQETTVEQLLPSAFSGEDMQ